MTKPICIQICTVSNEPFYMHIFIEDQKSMVKNAEKIDEILKENMKEKYSFTIIGSAPTNEYIILFFENFSVLIPNSTRTALRLNTDDAFYEWVTERFNTTRYTFT